MSATTRPPLILSEAQFEDMARKGAFSKVGRVELRRGMIALMRPVYFPHAGAMFALTQALVRALAGAPFRVLNEVSVRFGGGFMPTVNVVVWDPAAVPAGLEGPFPGEAARLVVEVADASLEDDLVGKALDYARAGLTECWVADVQGRTLTLHSSPTQDGYARVERVAFGQAVGAATLPLLVETAAL